MFKLINSIVETLAKFVAFTIAGVLTLFVWILYKTNAFFMITFAILIWVIYKVSMAINFLFEMVMWIPSKLGFMALGFALDISPEEQRKQIETLVKEIKAKRLVEERRALREATAAEADDETEVEVEITEAQIEKIKKVVRQVREERIEKAEKE